MARTKDSEPDFEKALAELEAIVAKLEQGDLPLEESLKQFERGVALTRSCQAALARAEQKVRILTQSGEGEVREEDFAPPVDE